LPARFRSAGPEPRGRRPGSASPARRLQAWILPWRRPVRFPASRLMPGARFPTSRFAPRARLPVLCRTPNGNKIWVMLSTNETTRRTAASSETTMEAAPRITLMLKTPTLGLPVSYGVHCSAYCGLLLFQCPSAAVSTRTTSNAHDRVMSVELDVHDRRLRVLGCVGQRFGHHVVRRDPDWVWQPLLGVEIQLAVPPSGGLSALSADWRPPSDRIAGRIPLEISRNSSNTLPSPSATRGNAPSSPPSCGAASTAPRAAPARG
jgi:hypothetical protein